MDITIDRSPLDRVLRNVSRQATNLGAQPWNGTITFVAEGGTLHVIADDGAVGVVSSTGTKVGEEGSVTVGYLPIGPFVSRMGDATFRLSTENSSLTARSTDGRAELTVGTMNISRPQRKLPDNEWVEVDPDQWKRLTHLARFTSRDSKRAVFQCIHLNEGEAFATDSYHLASLSFPGNATVSFPGSLFASVKPKADEVVRVATGDSEVAIATDDTLWVSPSLQVEPPDWRALSVPKDGDTITYIESDGGALAEAVSQVQAVHHDESMVNNEINIAFEPRPDDGELVIRAHSGGASPTRAEVVIPVETNCPYSFHMNGDYLKHCITILIEGGEEDQKLQWQLTDPTRPILGTRQDVTALVMPIRT